MVKKRLQYAATAVLLLAGALGCDQSSVPVVPAGASVLHLAIPARVQNLLFNKNGSVSAQNAVPTTGQGALEYNLTADGAAPVTGIILFNDVSQIGNIYINLPQGGTWLVAAELFSVYNPQLGSKNPSAKLTLPGLAANPLFAGAGKVDVQGTTPFTLDMEDIGTGVESNCYNGTLTDPTNCDYGLNGAWLDLYSFNTGASAASTVVFGSQGDLRAFFDGVGTQSTYLASTTGATFAYLGNGDLVNFPTFPAGTAFYPNTLEAKAAIAGTASAAITVNDIFAVKVPGDNAVVWLQVWVNSPVCVSNSTLMQFWFVYNNENLNYMKFDQTTNGLYNCNQNPTPTATP